MDDLISRAAALNALLMSRNYQDAHDMLEQLPAVYAVPVVHAEWIEEPDREGHYHCSNCGVVWGVSAMAMKYCPNCTAKMTNSPMWEAESRNA